MKTCIVVPTYNERENLPVLAEKIFRRGIEDLELFVVDDNSPDGTADVARSLSARYPIKCILRKKKEGLGKAYEEAFSRILSGGDCEVVIQMDADLSHDPNVIPLMLQFLGEHDVVLGSRYVKGGTIERWHFLRRLLSKLGNLYARAILSMPQKDVTSGFKCYRSSVLKKLIERPLSSLGYNFQIEILYRAHRLGYKILEIPIVFTERKAGSSKINLFIIFESFYKVLLLRIKDMFR